MKAPPLLLGAALLFWGWQIDFFWVGAVMAAALEGARLVKPRWEVSDEDFSRIWTFCSVLLLAAAVYAFTANEGPAQFSRLFRNPRSTNPSEAGAAGTRTAIALIRWLPAIFFLFVAAQAYSGREEIPLTTISWILKRRREKAEKLGQRLLPAPGLNVEFHYFAVCLFAAGGHLGDNSRYFWGLCVLLGWALWPRRSRRFGVTIWLGAFAAAVALGYTGQRSVGHWQNYIATLNPQWLSRFVRRSSDPAHSRTSLGRVGRLEQSGAIVIRLKPVTGGAPVYLREASYRFFKSPIWSARHANQHPRGPTEGFVGVNPEADGSTWVLLPNKTNSAKVQIACYLESRTQDSGALVGLLPLPTGYSQLENLPAFSIIRTNQMGAVLAEGPGLVQFDAGYGPGATIDSAPGWEDLRVPPAEQPALDQVISELQINNKGNGGTLLAVNRYFQSRFSYSTRQEPLKVADTNETPLTRFLLSTRSGHCEYFATATVLLLRKLHIPARYAVGYAVHEPSGKGYVVRQRDAHAWCLVWDDQVGIWRDFDTTPASWVKEESKRASPFQRLADGWSWIVFQFSKFRWGESHLRLYLLLLLVPALVLLLYQILFRRKRRRQGPPTTGSSAPIAWPGLDSEFYLIERKLAERGVARHPDQPLSDWLERVTRESTLAQLKEPLHELLRLHYRCRFDPRGLNAGARAELKRGTNVVLKTLAKLV